MWSSPNCVVASSVDVEPFTSIEPKVIDQRAGALFISFAECALVTMQWQSLSSELVAGKCLLILVKEKYTLALQ